MDIDYSQLIFAIALVALFAHGFAAGYQR